MSDITSEVKKFLRILAQQTNVRIIGGWIYDLIDDVSLESVDTSDYKMLWFASIDNTTTTYVNENGEYYRLELRNPTSEHDLATIFTTSQTSQIYDGIVSIYRNDTPVTLFRCEVIVGLDLPPGMSKDRYSIKTNSISQYLNVSDEYMLSVINTTH
jgi:hypothetical protein